jgi:Transposase IS66 family
LRHKKGQKARKERTVSQHGGEETLYNHTDRFALWKQAEMGVNRPKSFKDLNGLRSSTETVVRYDFDVCISATQYRVETVTDPRTGHSVRASMESVGPEGWQVTWKAMVNIVHLVVVFAMPAHRAAAFLGNNAGAFGQSTILRILQFVARAAAPVYEETCRQMAQSLRLQGDDSSTRVLAIEKQVRLAQGAFLSSKATEEDSKAKSADEIKAEQEQLKTQGVSDTIATVVQKMDSLLGFEFPTVTGIPKKRLQLTLVTGRIEAKNQFSQISVVRTHLGSFGNFLERLLSLRDKNNTELSVQSDLSSANHPPDSHDFQITFAGCLAHARRPFWRHREVDPLNCYFMLRGFALLSVVEDIIDCIGRTEEVSNYWRGRYGQKIWNILKSHCEKIREQHMPTSELHIAAKYIITHFTELTCYLSNSWLHPTNNQCERTLRSERIMLNNSKFRQSRGGRQTYDILRSIQLCCAGADVQFLDYLEWMLINHKEVAKAPEKWTPFAFRLKKEAEKAQK